MRWRAVTTLRSPENHAATDTPDVCEYVFARRTHYPLGPRLTSDAPAGATWVLYAGRLPARSVGTLPQRARGALAV